MSARNPFDPSEAARVLCLAATIACAPQSAHAFSDPLSFGDPVAQGGGGGRFFTGSAADGYGCDVCHAGAASPELRVLGLPLAGYTPGTAYEIRVEWPPDLEHLGLALEVADERGLAAGTLRLPAASERLDAERCVPASDDIPAGVLTELETRTVLSVPDCGARRVRFLWTAPQDARGTLRFSGGLVASDGEADAAGDGVTRFAHTLPLARSGVALASDIEGQCATGAVGSRRMHALPLMLLVGATVGCLRRGRRTPRRAHQLQPQPPPLAPRPPLEPSL